MATRFLEVDPFLIWQKGKKAEDVKMLTGGDLIKPWSDLRKLPEFSYQTSYKLGFPHNYQFDTFFEPPKKKGESLQQEERFKYEIFKNQYVTTTGSIFQPKYVKTEPGEKPSFIHYLDGFKEQFQTKMFLMPSFTTEHRSNFKGHVYDPKIAGELRDYTKEIICRSPKIAKEMQPSFEASEGGIRREKDIYLSQTHYAHHYFSPVKVRDIKESTEGPVPRLRIYENPHPIDPDLRIPFRQVNLLKKTYPVPHRGMLTETQERYTPQVDMFAPSDTVKDVEKIPMIDIPQSETIKEINKFHTEYNHIGHNWNTQNI